LFNSTLFHGIDDHTAANSIFDGTARVKELAFSQDLALYTFGLGDIVDPDQWRVSNTLCDIVLDLFGGVTLVDLVRAFGTVHARLNPIWAHLM